MNVKLQIVRFVEFLRQIFYVEDPWRKAYFLQRKQYEAQIGHLKFLLENERLNNLNLLESVHRYLGLIHEAQKSGSAVQVPVNTTPPSWAQQRARLENLESEKAQAKWREYANKNAHVIADADDVIVSDD